MSLANFLLIYVFGGLTFLPLLGGIMIIIMFPPWTWRLKRKETIKFDISPEDLPKINSASRDDSSYHKFGWLRVTREFDLNNPNNGASSGSTFGNMMKQGIASFMEGSSNSNKTKRTKDSFFAVLKYNTLFMYESERQLDWKGIIIVSNHDVTIFPEQLPDNEIFTKVNSIKLTKKPSICAEMALNLENHSGSATNYYLFCNTGVEKEDWYFALQRSSKLETNDNSGKQINKDKSQFDSFAMNHLLKTLYSNDDHMQTQWLNAILGRIFLSVYKTQAIKEYFIRKLVRKIKKVKKPGFLSDIQIRSVDVGDGIPYITNPELIKLSPEGELNVDINLNYTGCFRVEIETEAIISVTRLKHIKVPLVLAVVLRGLQGKMLVRIKPPPTNRLWMGFYDMPKLDLLIEPIVSETQLKFSPIINAIESKIHEMIMDSLVLPNMDDVPFFNSFGMGGIYEGEVEQLQQQADTQQEAEIPSTPPALSSIDSEKETSKLAEEESVVADIPLTSTANEELRQALNSAPGKLESIAVKPDVTKIEVSNVNINTSTSIVTPVKAESTTESNNSSSSWTSRATKIKSALHESFSDPNLLKTNRLRSISKQFIKQRTDDSSTIVKDSMKEPVNESNKEPLSSTSSTTSNSSNSSIQTAASSQSTLRRWSQSVGGIRRRTGISGILSHASITSNNSNSSNNDDNSNNTNSSDNTNNITSNTSNNTSNNTESDVQKSQNNSTESIPTISTDAEDSVDKQVLVENFSPLSSSPLNISPLNISPLSTSPSSVVSPTITSSPSRSTSMESLSLPTSSHSTKSTTQNDATAPTPPPSPTKSPKEHPGLHIPHSPHSPHSFSSPTKSTYNRDLFLSENALNDNDFFPEVTPSILNTPVEELHSVLG